MISRFNSILLLVKSLEQTDVFPYGKLKRGVCMQSRTGELSIMPNIPEISVQSQMERSFRPFRFGPTGIST